METTTTPDKFVELARVLCDKIGAFTLEDADLIASACLRVLPPLRDADQESAQAFVDRLVPALRAQIASTNAEFLA
jgi:hypothetical protein